MNGQGYFGHLDSHLILGEMEEELFKKKSWDIFTHFSLNSLSTKEETISSSKVTSKSEMAFLGIRKILSFQTSITFF